MRWVLLAIVVLVGIIFILRMKIVKMLEPLLKEGLKESPFADETEVLNGIKHLQLSLGFALVVILWQSFLYYMRIATLRGDIITLILLLSVVWINWRVYSHFSKGLHMPADTLKNDK